MRFDLAQLEVLSEPATMVDDVSMSPEAGGGSHAANYEVSRRGALVYIQGGEADGQRSLVWVDRTGRETPTGASPNVYSEPRLSPDGTRVAVTIRDRLHDIHVFDLKRRTL